MISKCGVICSKDCKAYLTECAGCNELSGKVEWAKFYALDKCPIYSCVVSKGFSDCGECGKAPCKLWVETRDPAIDDQSFQEDLSNRLDNLDKYSEVK